MRVVLVTGHATGGVAGHVGELADGLGAAGVDRLVVTSALTSARWRRVGAASGAPVLELWPELRRPLATALRLRRLRTVLRGADVVHAHGHQAGLLTSALLGGRRGGRRGPGPALVVTWHNAVLGAAGPGRALRVLAERLQVRRADLLTGASGDLVARARALGAPGPELTPVAVPDRTLGPGHERAAAGTAPPPGPEAPPGTALVLTVSRLAPQKDLPTLVRAAARLTHPAVWCVVGDGDEEVAQRVRRLAADLHAPVRLLGARDDVPALLARADVFVLSSVWEARSLAVQEAMAAGLPVVATRTGGLPDLLEGVGALVPVGDDRALAAAVDAMLDDPVARERAGLASRAAFLALPRPADVLRGWLDRYARLTRAR